MCSVSLVRETVRVSLPLFWTRTQHQEFLQNYSKFQFQNLGFSVALPEHTNYNLLGRHVVDRPCNRRNVDDDDDDELFLWYG